MSRSLSQSESLSRVLGGQSESAMSRSVSQSLSRSQSMSSHPISAIRDDSSHQSHGSLLLRDSAEKRPLSKRSSLPSPRSAHHDSSANHLRAPQVSQTKITPTNNPALPTDDVANAPVARQRRTRQSIGKAPRKSLSEEFRHSVDKGDEGRFSSNFFQRVNGENHVILFNS